LEEDKFKDSPETIKSAVDTILKCLEINADYISKDNFWDIVKKIIISFTKAKDRRTLNKILSGINLNKLAGRIENINNYYSNDLEKEEKSALNTFHTSLCDSIVNLLGVLIVYNKINPSKEALRAKEAIKEWSKSYPNTKTSILDEWENIEIPSWKKGKRYFIKIYSHAETL
jgi:tyrosyl-tRNA synthetase